MAEDFYAKEEVAQPEGEQEVVEEVGKVKVGEKEYSQDELNELVKIGEWGKEAEEKYNKPISKFWPEYTKEHQERLKLEAELQDLKQAQTFRQNTGEQTDEQLRAQAIEQAKALGLMDADSVRQIVNQTIEAKDLLSDITAIQAESTEVGKPTVETEELLQFMSDQGIKNPYTAYEILRKDEIKAWESKQLGTLKKEPMVTESSSTAGSKQPELTKITDANLSETLKNYLARDGQQ